MQTSEKSPNRLTSEISPYLLQHVNNPVDWYPWGNEAFEKAKAEDKPIFLSIGYSTCHWCHVMAHESFEDAEVSDILNQYFVPVKVDKEERPDVDSVYMKVCIALTGSGGWPLTVIMDQTGKPFFAGTYFSKYKRYEMPGLIDILNAISETWLTNRSELLDFAEKMTALVNAQNEKATAHISPERTVDTAQLINKSLSYFESAFDRKYGGFGRAPKFPFPHNLLFLMEAYQNLHDRSCLEMAEKTLLSMAKGGIFDHIGFGFSRYSTDNKWLAPHFEKMLYNNALLIMAYTRAYEITRKPVYKAVAERTVLYIKREMTHPGGGFYSAQDADSDGVEGKYYVFTPEEIISVMGQDQGQEFCRLYDITKVGNFEGKNIPNQINKPELDDSLSTLLPKLYKYRKTRTDLHTDDKILTAWNALMIAALIDASTVFGNASYLESAKKAARFIEINLCENSMVFTSFREGKRTNTGFLDDYAFYAYALLRFYYATRESDYLNRAKSLLQKVVEDFFDNENGGFYLTGRDSESLVARPKETYDGAIPSGNSVMVMNLVILNLLTGAYEEIMKKQINFMALQAVDASAGHSFFLYSMLKAVLLNDNPVRYRPEQAV